MRIAIAGGGPAGLYAAILLLKLGAGHEVTIWERNAPDDTFGFGVVFSDETLGAFEVADPPSYERIVEQFARWGDIDIQVEEQVLTSRGHGFSALGRRALLQLLHERSQGLGATLRFRADAPPVAELAATHDLVIGADGRNSSVRTQLQDAFSPTFDRRRCKYMWLGTDRAFDAFKFFIRETPHGVFQVHAYPYDEASSTFIVETREETWRAAGLDGDADHGIAFTRELFADVLGGHELIANNSRWVTFDTLRTRTWRAGNVVLLGDAAHTAHFSIGSGTKLAMEDAIALSWEFRDGGDVGAALERYEAERRPVVESTQRAAQASLEWFEGLPRYLHQPPRQFAFNLLTRSRRITHEELTLRDPEFLLDVQREVAPPGVPADVPPMFWPFRIGALELRNRVVVSPMDMYSADDGLIGDFHLVHLGSRGLGGAGLVMSEMICVSREARITPGCGGLYREEHTAAWKRVVDFVHAHGETKIGAQLGHSGRKGATRLMWEGVDQPLEHGAWPVVSASPIPYFPHSQVPREITRAEMDAVRDDFVVSTRRAAEAGFDLLELHMAHGYLLSSFLSPVTNRRRDEYGGDLAARARYPLEVLAACREAWPAERPVSVRISATDWVDGGFTGDDAVALAPMLAAHGADIVDVSTGQVTPDAKPAYGRSYQTPFADRIRNEAGIPTIAVGAISSAADLNTIILAGRADLCALGRPHLYDPYWTLHAAAEQDVPMPWIAPYRAGSRRPQTGKDKVRSSLRAIEAGEARPTAPQSGRWLPRTRAGSSNVAQ